MFLTSSVMRLGITYSIHYAIASHLSLYCCYWR